MGTSNSKQNILKEAERDLHWVLNENVRWNDHATAARMMLDGGSVFRSLGPVNGSSANAGTTSLSSSSQSDGVSEFERQVQTVFKEVDDLMAEANRNTNVQNMSTRSGLSTARDGSSHSKSSSGSSFSSLFSSNNNSHHDSTSQSQSKGSGSSFFNFGNHNNDNSQHSGDSSVGAGSNADIFDPERSVVLPLSHPAHQFQGSQSFGVAATKELVLLHESANINDAKLSEWTRSGLDNLNQHANANLQSSLGHHLSAPSFAQNRLPGTGLGMGTWEVVHSGQHAPPQTATAFAQDTGITAPIVAAPLSSAPLNANTALVPVNSASQERVELIAKYLFIHNLFQNMITNAQLSYQESLKLERMRKRLKPKRSRNMPVEERQSMQSTYDSQRHLFDENRELFLKSRLILQWLYRDYYANFCAIRLRDLHEVILAHNRSQSIDSTLPLGVNGASRPTDSQMYASPSTRSAKLLEQCRTHQRQVQEFLQSNECYALSIAHYYLWKYKSAAEEAERAGEMRTTTQVPSNPRSNSLGDVFRSGLHSSSNTASTSSPSSSSQRNSAPVLGREQKRVARVDLNSMPELSTLFPMAVRNLNQAQPSIGGVSGNVPVSNAGLRPNDAAFMNGAAITRSELHGMIHEYSRELDSLHAQILALKGHNEMISGGASIISHTTGGGPIDRLADINNSNGRILAGGANVNGGQNLLVVQQNQREINQLEVQRALVRQRLSEIYRAFLAVFLKNVFVNVDWNSMHEPQTLPNEMALSSSKTAGESLKSAPIDAQGLLTDLSLIKHSGGRVFNPLDVAHEGKIGPHEVVNADVVSTGAPLPHIATEVKSDAIDQSEKQDRMRETGLLDTTPTGFGSGQTVQPTQAAPLIVTNLEQPADLGNDLVLLKNNALKPLPSVPLEPKEEFVNNNGLNTTGGFETNRGLSKESPRTAMKSLHPSSLQQQQEAQAASTAPDIRETLLGDYSTPSIPPSFLPVSSNAASLTGLDANEPPDLVAVLAPISSGIQSPKAKPHELTPIAEIVTPVFPQTDPLNQVNYPTSVKEENELDERKNQLLHSGPSDSFEVAGKVPEFHQSHLYHESQLPSRELGADELPRGYLQNRLHEYLGPTVSEQSTVFSPYQTHASAFSQLPGTETKAQGLPMSEVISQRHPQEYELAGSSIPALAQTDAIPPISREMIDRQLIAGPLNRDSTLPLPSTTINYAGHNTPNEPVPLMIQGDFPRHAALAGSVFSVDLNSARGKLLHVPPSSLRQEPTGSIHWVSFPANVDQSLKPSVLELNAQRKKLKHIKWGKSQRTLGGGIHSIAMANTRVIPDQISAPQSGMNSNIALARLIHAANLKAHRLKALDYSTIQPSMFGGHHAFGADIGGVIDPVALEHQATQLDHVPIEKSEPTKTGGIHMISEPDLTVVPEQVIQQDGAANAMLAPAIRARELRVQHHMLSHVPLERQRETISGGVHMNDSSAKLHPTLLDRVKGVLGMEPESLDRTPKGLGHVVHQPSLVEKILAPIAQPAAATSSTGVALNSSKSLKKTTSHSPVPPPAVPNSQNARLARIIHGSELERGKSKLHHVNIARIEAHRDFMANVGSVTTRRASFRRAKTVMPPASSRLQPEINAAAAASQMDSSQRPLGTNRASTLDSTHYQHAYQNAATSNPIEMAYPQQGNLASVTAPLTNADLMRDMGLDLKTSGLSFQPKEQPAQEIMEPRSMTAQKPNEADKAYVVYSDGDVLASSYKEGLQSRGSALTAPFIGKHSGESSLGSDDVLTKERKFDVNSRGIEQNTNLAAPIAANTHIPLTHDHLP